MYRCLCYYLVSVYGNVSVNLVMLRFPFAIDNVELILGTT